MDSYKILAKDLCIGDCVSDAEPQYTDKCVFQLVGRKNGLLFMQLVSGDASLYETVGPSLYAFDETTEYKWNKIN